MPLNSIKTYNQLLEIAFLSEQQRRSSLMLIFDRDIANNNNFVFNNKPITPTPKDGVIIMETLFSHLTTVMTDKVTRKREFDIKRSERLHWLKFHIELNKQNDILVFSVDEPEGTRTYIYDVEEKYVIILEPLKMRNAYYLITAYHLVGKDEKRDKIIKKYKRRLPVLV